jgi:hypothetical protein
MSRNIIFVLMYHSQKLLDLTDLLGLKSKQDNNTRSEITRIPLIYSHYDSNLIA